MGQKRINIIKVKEQLERARKKKEFLKPLLDHYLILGRHQYNNYTTILGIYYAYCQEEAEALHQLDLLKRGKKELLNRVKQITKQLIIEQNNSKTVQFISKTPIIYSIFNSIIFSYFLRTIS